MKDELSEKVVVAEPNLWQVIPHVMISILSGFLLGRTADIRDSVACVIWRAAWLLFGFFLARWVASDCRPVVVFSHGVYIPVRNGGYFGWNQVSTVDANRWHCVFTFSDGTQRAILLFALRNKAQVLVAIERGMMLKEPARGPA